MVPPARKFSEENSPTIVVTDCDGGTEEEDSSGGGHFRTFQSFGDEEFGRYRTALRPDSPLGGSAEKRRGISESSSFDGWDPPTRMWEEPAGSPLGDNLTTFFTGTSLVVASQSVSDLRSGLEQSFQGFQIEELADKEVGLESYQSPSLQAEFFSVSSMDSATLTDLDELMKSELQKF
jgi:hypothetical protein